MEYPNLETLLQCEFLETDKIDLIISESPYVEKVLECILENHLEKYLKVNFSKKAESVKEEIMEDHNFKEYLREMLGEVLDTIFKEFGGLQFKEDQEREIHPMWLFKKARR